jgi:hypothetical protein
MKPRTHPSRLASIWPLCLPLVLLGASGCYMEVKDGGKDAKAGDTRVDHPDAMPAALQGRAQSCDAASAAQTGQGPAACYTDADFKWRTSCRSESCQPVKVFTHYMLAQDLTGAYAVHVEAFDNEHFQGAPVSSVRLGNFAAKRGEMKEADLFVEPGEYYLRAYMTADDDSAAPYTLGDMTLVADQPVGVFGALSGAEMLRVAPRDQDRYPAPVDIFLDKLFQKPGATPDTNAHLRLALSVGDGVTVPDARQVHIRLFQSSDLAATPLYDFAMASELLLVQGRVGKAEYVSPSLKEGPYVVYAFVDANGNGLPDADEAAGVYTVDGHAQTVAIAKDRTETIALTLVAPSGSGATH